MEPGGCHLKISAVDHPYYVHFIKIPNLLDEVYSYNVITSFSYTGNNQPKQTVKMPKPVLLGEYQLSFHSQKKALKHQAHRIFFMIINIFNFFLVCSWLVGWYVIPLDPF